MLKPYIHPLFIILICFSLRLTGSYAIVPDKYNWKAGVAKTDITPTGPIWMGGYAARDKPSEGIIHPIWIKALALEDNQGNHAVLVTSDLIGFRQQFSNRVRERLKQDYGLSKAQIILNSSHTHSGPITDAERYSFKLKPEHMEPVNAYLKQLEEQVVALVGMALANMEPAHLHSGNGVSRFQVNRRNNNERELTPLTALNGPNDYAVPVLKVENEAGEIKAVVFGYACHPTVLPFYDISGDYPGFAQIELEKMYPEAVAMFFQGAGGDQNPLPRRSVPLAQQYGKTLASSVEAVLLTDMKSLKGELHTAYTEIDLSFANAPPTEDELLKIIDPASDFPTYLKEQHAQVLLHRLKQGETLPHSYPFPVQVWKLGDQAIFNLGGEILVGYALALKSTFGQDIFVMGYSNDLMGYIPTAKVLEEGGYEGDRSAIFTTPWAPDIEEKILHAATQLSQELGIMPLEEKSPD